MRTLSTRDKLLDYSGKKMVPFIDLLLSLENETKYRQKIIPVCILLRQRIKKK
uniref:Uncharacterized protein n=1 Tax=Anguilla anguilla TaxID=7936 RepID=A0A0E9W2E5_ANGAN